MTHCWEEYMWKVHKAVPVDPWTTNVQLLDVLIEERTTIPWLHKRNKASSNLSRAGSTLTLGKPKVVAKASGGDVGGPMQQLDSNSSGAATLVQPIDKNSNIGDANSDIRHSAQLIKSGSASPFLNKNTPNGDTAGPTHVLNDINNSATACAQCQHVQKNSDSSMELIHKTLSYSMPDIQASISSSTSLLASFTGGSSATAQFDAKGSRTVTCNVGGVKSDHVDVDALMQLVTPCTSCGCALWQPDTDLPQLQFSCKRGQTLWVVTEIMSANSISVKADNQAKSSGTAKVGGGLAASEEVGAEKDGVWKVTAPTDKPTATFPFALRLQMLKYDAQGRLTAYKNLKRNSSLNAIKPITSKHVDALSRSSSVSTALLGAAPNIAPRRHLFWRVVTGCSRFSKLKASG